MDDGLVLGQDLKNINKASFSSTTTTTNNNSSNNNDNNSNNDNNDNNHNNDNTNRRCWWQARYTLVVLAFTGITLAYMVRVCISIVIVAIVKNNQTENAANLSDVCPMPLDDDSQDDMIEGEYEWSGQTQATILGAFFYGYTVTNFAGGRAAEYLGAKPMFGLGVVLPSLLSLLSPLCIHTSPALFIALRVLEGMAQGVLFPSIHLMVAAWMPPQDKAKYWSFIASGMQMGTVFAMSVGGWLCNTTFLGGWPAVFYVFGVLGVMWGVPWLLIVHNLPEEHPRIDQDELQYILEHRCYVKRDKVVAIPWRDIATSVPFWAIMSASMCSTFCFNTLLTELPTYFNNILHFDMNKNGLSSALPYVAQSGTGITWALFVDVLQQKNLLSVISVRKISTGIALFLSAACLIGMRWVRCDSVLALVVLCLAVGLLGTMSAGCTLSEQDIAPNLTGTVKGLTNTLGSTTGFIAPAITGAITTGNQTLTAWNTVFILTAVLNLVFGTIYLIFITDKVQPWNNPAQPYNMSLRALPSQPNITTPPQDETDGTHHHTNIGYPYTRY